MSTEIVTATKNEKERIYERWKKRSIKSKPKVINCGAEVIVQQLRSAVEIVNDATMLRTATIIHTGLNSYLRYTTTHKRSRIRILLSIGSAGSFQFSRLLSFPLVASPSRQTPQRRRWANGKREAALNTTKAGSIRTTTATTANTTSSSLSPSLFVILVTPEDAALAAQPPPFHFCHDVSSPPHARATLSTPDTKSMLSIFNAVT